MFRFGWMKRATDEELLLEFGRGRSRAFEEIVARYGGPIEGYARRLLQNPQLAEEVVADTFERLARELGSSHIHSTLRGYIFSIAHNRCIDLLRRQRREQSACSRLLEEEGTRPRPLHPEAAARLGELARVLEEALGRLPAHHRQVVLLRLVHGLSGEETARVLGCAEEQVRSQLSYARKLIRRHLAAQEGSPVFDHGDADTELGTI